MAGIYIPGIEMPTNCYECKCGYWENEYCFPVCILTDEEAAIEDYVIKRMKHCPLVPVPDHGDLIEREPLRASIKESVEECHKWADEVSEGEMYARVSQALGTFVECSLRVKAAPTIIPADKEGEA